MVRSRILALLPAALLLAPMALPARAGAIGMTESYPREYATTGTGGGVRLTHFQASVRKAGARVRVSVRLAGASVSGTRRLTISVAACTVTTKTYKNAYEAPDAPSRPTCRTGLTSATVTATPSPFALTRAFTIPRPATRPGALRVRVVTQPGGTTAVPPCTGYVEICGVTVTGDLLLNGNTWRHRPGTWWGIVATPPAGVTLDRIVFRSRMGGWVATSAAAAKVLTTWGYAGEQPARTQKTSLRAGVQRVMRRNSTFGGEFETRRTIRVLDHAATIDGQRLFTMTLPLPVWTSRYPAR